MRHPYKIFLRTAVLCAAISTFCGCARVFMASSASPATFPRQETRREIRDKAAAIPLRIPAEENIESITLKPIFMDKYGESLAEYGEIGEDGRSFEITDRAKIREILSALGGMELRFVPWKNNTSAIPVSNDLCLNWKEGRQPGANELTTLGFYNSFGEPDESERKRVQVIMTPGSRVYDSPNIRLLDPGSRRGHLKWFSASVTADGLEALKECLED